jgi:hypothetical protein
LIIFTCEEFFPGFFPCLTGGETPVIQILPAQPFIDQANGKRFNFDPIVLKPGMMIYGLLIMILNGLWKAA